MQVFHEFIPGQPLISYLSYLGHRYFGGLNLILWYLTPGSMPGGGARGQNLGHLIHLYSFIFKVFMSSYLGNP